MILPDTFTGKFLCLCDLTESHLFSADVTCFVYDLNREYLATSAVKIAASLLSKVYAPASGESIEATFRLWIILEPTTNPSSFSIWSDNGNPENFANAPALSTPSRLGSRV
jgi:hypothetical protein